MGSWIIGESYDIVRQSNDSRTMTYGFTMIAWWEGNIALYMRVEWCNGHATCMMSYEDRMTVVRGGTISDEAVRRCSTTIAHISYDWLRYRVTSYAIAKVIVIYTTVTSIAESFWTWPKTAKTLWYCPPPPPMTATWLRRCVMSHTYTRFTPDGPRSLEFNHRRSLHEVVKDGVTVV